MNERLIKIETKISFQEDLLEELNKVVFQQQKKLQQLEAMCVSLANHIQTMSPNENGIVLSNERPPHY